MHICHSTRVEVKGEFAVVSSLLLLWVPGFELRSSGLAADTFTISLALACFDFNLSHEVRCGIFFMFVLKSSDFGTFCIPKFWIRTLVHGWCSCFVSHPISLAFRDRNSSSLYRVLGLPSRPVFSHVWAHANPCHDPLRSRRENEARKDELPQDCPGGKWKNRGQSPELQNNTAHDCSSAGPVPGQLQTWDCFPAGPIMFGRFLGFWIWCTLKLKNMS